VKWAIALAAALLAGTAFGRGEMPATIQDVKARHASQLMAQPGVVAVGIGRDPDGNEAIIVSLDRDRPEVRESVPHTLEGYAVRVQVIGPVRAR
jgi:hypothetical protein